MPSVAVIGASAKPERYSHQAIVGYLAAGWTVHPVSPSGEAVLGRPGYQRIEEVPGPLDIVCLYVNPTVGLGLIPAIAAKAPKLLWLNPGTESPELIAAAKAAGLKLVEACTLVVQRQGDPLQLGLRAAS